MKYIVLLCDGMSDEPLAELGGKTPIEYANTPNMDKLASEGQVGFIHTTPEGFAPGSDICNMSIFGYDPRKYYTGRSPLEAISMGIQLGANDMAFRCNLVTLANGIMEDFSAHHIDNNSASAAIQNLQRLFNGTNIEFYQGLSYRHLMVVRNADLELQTTPPHDITGQEIASYLPKGKDASFIQGIINKSAQAFGVNTGKANSIWLWGQGKRPALPLFKDTFGINGAAISAVDLIKGIAVCVGMELIDVPGVTAFIDTNFAGKASYAIEALKHTDYVYVHVEAPDETGHMGDVKLKLQAIESIDSIMLPIIVNGIRQFDEYRILLTPDHPTPIRTMTHAANPVPAILYGTGIKPDTNKYYSENIDPSFEIENGYEIAKKLIIQQ